jgi:hypothetical protein
VDLNAACQPKRNKAYWQVRIFKCPLKKTQPSCPGSRDLNWTGKGLFFALFPSITSQSLGMEFFCTLYIFGSD